MVLLSKFASHIAYVSMWLRTMYRQASISLLLLNEMLLSFKIQKSHQQRKKHIKSTYPPPADGLCVPFLCKARW